MKKVLIIDDNLETLKIIMYSLEEQYECFTLPNPLDALDIIKKESIDLVITDIVMPHKNGLELISDIREIYTSEQVKIIAISSGGAAFSATSYLNVAKKMAANRIIEKPFRVEKLISVVNELI
jgi:DNA-binding response OmpR family regulator